MIRMRTRALALTAAAAAASLVLTGTSMALASPDHAAPAAKRTGTEFIQEMSTSPTSPKSQVIAYGVFTATGVDTSLSNTVDRLSFPGGTFIATSKFTGARMHADPGTCVSTVIVSLTYKLGKGTGQFAGITGSGHVTTTILTIAARTANGKCSATKDIAQQSLVEASGPITLR
jgi:glucose/arabinose dehydrogenase